MEFSRENTMQVSYEKVVTVSLSDSDIDDIMVGAIEGGISYWGFIAAKTKRNKPQDEPTSQWCTKILLDGGTVFIKDNEEPEYYELTLNNLLKGVKQYMEKQNDDMDTYDAESYDCIIQYALFDGVIFG